MKEVTALHMAHVDSKELIIYIKVDVGTWASKT